MLRLTTLGAIDLRDRLGHPLRDVLAQPKRIALLTFLALESRRGPVSRDRIVALFWPEADEARARNALSQALYHLRGALGDGVIESQGPNALQVVGETLWCDATAFGEALDRGEIELALDLYRGEFCPALFMRGGPELEQWLDGERRQFRRRALLAARALAERQAAAGDLVAARSARRALAMQPDDEGDVRALLALMEKSGDRAGALLAYQEYARRLAAEVEAEPSAETRMLVEAMRRRESHLLPPLPSVERGIDTLPSPRSGEGPGVRRFHFRLAFLTLAALATLAAGVVVTVRARTQPAAQAGKTLAVFPFMVRGGSSLDYLGDGLVDMLSAKLDGSLGIRALDPRSIFTAVSTHDSLDELPGAARERIARELGAGWYIGGDAIEVAGQVQLTGTLVDLDRGTRTTATVVGDTSALFQLVDDLAGRMLARLVPGGRDTALTQLAAVTTHSLPALRRFLDGERALREGQDAQAATAFREAAMLDTTFALAQYRLAVLTTWVDVPEIGSPLEWASTAARHAERLAPLARDLLTAYRAYKDLRSPTAERLYRSITGSHPDNVEAWFMLGEVLFHYNSFRGRSPVEATAPFERVLLLDPTNAHAMVHLARLAAFEGHAARVDSLVQRYLDRYPQADRAAEMKALRAYVHDDPVELRAVARSAPEGDEIQMVSLLQAALLYSQNLDGVRDLLASFHLSQGTGLHHKFGQVYQAELPLVAGRWSQATALGGRDETFDAAGWQLEVKALLAVEPVLDIPRPVILALRDSLAARLPYRQVSIPSAIDPVDLGDLVRSYLLGLLSVRLGDSASANRHLAEVGAVRDAPRSLQAGYLASGLRAEIARAAGNPERALAELERFHFDISNPGVPSMAHWGVHERFLKAEMLHAIGRDTEALAWYGSFHNNFDAPWIPLAHFRQGEIHASLGNTERSAFHYRRFVSLWRDSDPRFQEMLARARRGMR